MEQDIPFERVLYNRVINGRRFVVTELGYKNPSKETREFLKACPEAVTHYCGYMQILPKDAEYSKANVNATYFDWADEPFKSALGGITWVGPAPEWFQDKAPGRYVGFDTGHYGLGKVTELQVIASTLHMRKELAGVKKCFQLMS